MAAGMVQDARTRLELVQQLLGQCTSLVEHMRPSVAPRASSVEYSSPSPFWPEYYQDPAGPLGAALPLPSSLWRSRVDMAPKIIELFDRLDASLGVMVAHTRALDVARTSEQVYAPLRQERRTLGLTAADRHAGLSFLAHHGQDQTAGDAGCDAAGNVGAGAGGSDQHDAAVADSARLSHALSLRSESVSTTLGNARIPDEVDRALPHRSAVIVSKRSDSMRQTPAVGKATVSASIGRALWTQRRHGDEARCGSNGSRSDAGADRDQDRSPSVTSSSEAESQQTWALSFQRLHHALTVNMPERLRPYLPNTVARPLGWSMGRADGQVPAPTALPSDSSYIPPRPVQEQHRHRADVPPPCASPGWILAGGMLTLLQVVEVALEHLLTRLRELLKFVHSSPSVLDSFPLSSLHSDLARYTDHVVALAQVFPLAVQLSMSTISDLEQRYNPEELDKTLSMLKLPSFWYDYFPVLSQLRRVLNAATASVSTSWENSPNELLRLPVAMIAEVSKNPDVNMAKSLWNLPDHHLVRRPLSLLLAPVAVCRYAMLHLLRADAYPSYAAAARNSRSPPQAARPESPPSSASTCSNATSTSARAATPPAADGGFIETRVRVMYHSQLPFQLPGDASARRSRPASARSVSLDSLSAAVMESVTRVVLPSPSDPASTEDLEMREITRRPDSPNAATTAAAAAAATTTAESPAPSCRSIDQAGLSSGESSEESDGIVVDKSCEFILHFHGGGFISQSSGAHEPYLRIWTLETEAIVVSVDYHKAPEFPFPLPFDECFAVYRFILDGGFDGYTPSRIVLAGDSAGGNLAAAVTLRAISQGLRLPDALCLFYPAMELVKRPSVSRLLAVSDPLVPSGFLQMCMRSYVPPDVDAKHPYLSPLRASPALLSRFPPTRIYGAGFDPLLDDYVMFAQRLMELDRSVELEVLPQWPHGFLSIQVIPDVLTVVKAASAWMRSHLYDEDHPIHTSKQWSDSGRSGVV